MLFNSVALHSIDEVCNRFVTRSRTVTLDRSRTYGFVLQMLQMLHPFKKPILANPKIDILWCL